MSSPLVGVLASRKIPGLDSLETKEAVYLEVLPLDEALRREWKTDAHFTTYQVRGETGWPRMNKPVLHEVRQAGSDLETQLVVLDYDNEDHGVWNDKMLGDFLDRLEYVGNVGNPFAFSWHALYLTKHGLRLVYVLDKPVPVDEAEPLTRGVVSRFQQDQIYFDPGCADWTRLFRLPFVTREDGNHTEETWLPNGTGFKSQLGFGTEILLDISLIKPQGPPSAVEHQIPVQELDLKQPTDDQILGLLGTAGEWYKQARKELFNAYCFENVFEGKPLAEPGHRNRAIFKTVGEVIARLFNLQGTNPEKVYALLHSPVSEFEPDAETGDWLYVLWNAVLRLWAKEQGKEQARKQEVEIQKVGAHRVLSDMRRGIRRWSQASELGLEDAHGDHWLSQRLIYATAHGHYYLIGRNGELHPHLVEKGYLLPVLVKQLGLQSVIQLERVTKNGSVPISTEEILRNHARMVSGSVEYHCSTLGNHVLGIETNNPIIKLVPFKRRTDIPGKFNKNVDQFLRLQWGTSWEKVEPWFSWMPGIEFGPICALSLCGPRGIGKKLLAQGMAECFTGERYATSRVFTKFNGELLYSPILHINEGITGVSHIVADIPDLVRSLVAGDPTVVEMKFREPVIVRIPFRMLICANNLGPLQQLTGNRDLTNEDQGALGQRLIHHNATDEAAKWLVERGGVKFTRGWIAGDSGEPSNYDMAEHFMWMFENRKESKGTRFLVEGNSDLMIERMAAKSGTAPAVIEVVISMIEGSPTCRGLCEDKWGYWVTAMGVVNKSREDLFRDSRLNHKNVGSVLSSLAHKDSPVWPSRRIDSATKKEVGARWHHLDLKKLLWEAVQQGYPHFKIQDKVKQLFGQEVVEEILEVR